MSKASEVQKELKILSSPERAKSSMWFFKTGKGQYGEGDKFIGVSVPDQRRIAKKFKGLNLDEIKKLLESKTHEHRLTAFMILVENYNKATDPDKQKIYNFYIQNARHANNWDLVDSSAPYISGPFLVDKKDRKILYELARSKNLWEQRIAIMSTAAFIRNLQFNDTFKISLILLHHPHDLIHKAVGWMLREVGNRDLRAEELFLKKHYKEMPRTMLRYAIEKFEEGKRQKYLKGLI